MAIISYTIQNILPGVRIATWSSVTQADTCRPVVCPQYSDKSFQVYGSFGSGGEVVLEGTNEVTSPSNYATLRDPRGGANTIDSFSAGMSQVLENCYQVRPRVSAGTGVNLTIVLLMSTPTAYSNAEV